MKKLIFILSLSLLLIPFKIYSQGTIKGKIYDKIENESIIGAHVIIRQNGKILIGTTTDKDGRFTLKPLNPGLYTVTCKYVGYKPIEIRSVKVSENQITFIGKQFMQSGIDLEAPVIKGYKNDLIHKDGGMISAMDGKKWAKTPNPGDVKMSLINLSSEFHVNERTRKVTFRGTREGETAYYIDGVRVDSPNGIPKSAVSNVKVYTGGVPAKYGDFMGAVVVIETKSYFDCVQERQALARKFAKSSEKAEQTTN